MLALITQTKLPRPWLQLGTAGAVHLPVKAIDAEPQGNADSMPPMPLEAPNVGHQLKSSRIPRLIRIPRVRKAISTRQINIASDPAIRRQTNMTTTTTTKITTQSSSLGSSAPVVRSTRTSRCRIQLAHPDWSVTDANQCLNLNANGKNSSKPQQQMICLECCDRMQLDVPCYLLKRYSTLLRQHLKKSNKPLRLDAISSQTLLRLIMWMQQHYHDDLCQLQKTLPSLAHACSPQSTWDEQFLGFNMDTVLQLLLAANYLGIHPLLEHVTHYFDELVEQHNTGGQLQMQQARQIMYDNSSSSSSIMSNSSGSKLCDSSVQSSADVSLEPV